MSLFYFVLQRTGRVHYQLPCLTEGAESVTWSLKMSIKLLIFCFGLRLFGGLQQFAVSRCFRFPVVLVSLIQCENTLLLLAGCSWSTICMVAHFWSVFLTATCSCCGEDLPRSLPEHKSRQQEQIFKTITSCLRPCKQKRYFFSTWHCPSFNLIPPDNCMVAGKKHRVQLSSLCWGLGLMQKTRESYFLVPLLKVRQHLFSVTLLGLVLSLLMQRLSLIFWCALSTVGIKMCDSLLV